LRKKVLCGRGVFYLDFYHNLWYGKKVKIILPLSYPQQRSRMPYKRIIGGVVFIFLLSIVISSAQEAKEKAAIPEPQQREDIGLRKLEEEINSISVSGRLALSQEKEGNIILQGKDAKAYLLEGELLEQLKNLLGELGEKNIVTLKGLPTDSYNVICNNAYKTDAEGKRILETQCLRYYHLKVNQIVEANISDENMPPPERDLEAERSTKQSSLLPRQSIIQIKGKISALNLIRSAVKTVEITFNDKDNQVIKKTLLLSQNTRVAKKNADTGEPLYLNIDSLKVGQEVAVGYSRDESKSEALFITITKE